MRRSTGRLIGRLILDTKDEISGSKLNWSMYQFMLVLLKLDLNDSMSLSGFNQIFRELEDYAKIVRKSRRKPRNSRERR